MKQIITFGNSPPLHTFHSFLYVDDKTSKQMEIYPFSIPAGVHRPK